MAWWGSGPFIFDGAADEIGFLPVTDPYVPPGPGGGQVKVWNGSTWVAKPVKVWNGTSWVVKPLKIWNGSAFVETNY